MRFKKSFKKNNRRRGVCQTEHSEREKIAALMAALWAAVALSRTRALLRTNLAPGHRGRPSIDTAASRGNPPRKAASRSSFASGYYVSGDAPAIGRSRGPISAGRHLILYE